MGHIVLIRCLPIIAVLGFSTPSWADTARLGEGWTLRSDASSLQFTPAFEEGTAQASSFDSIEGEIGADGTVQMSIALDSVETGDDLQDARVRFLLFESFRNPVAQVTAKIEPEMLDRLVAQRSAEVTLPVAVNLNGQTARVEVALNADLLTDEVVSVTTTQPIRLSLGDFNLLPGLDRLKTASGVEILPIADISFELLFQAGTGAGQGPVQTVSLVACADRVATIAATDQVYFESGSAELESKSFPLLDTIADTIRQCDGMDIVIEGHTDDRGSDAFNQALSDRRAASVVTYLTVRGIAADRLDAVGFGEARPIADNNTRRGRWQNRRIEFRVQGL